MIGFDGDPARLSALHAALRALLEVFPEHLAKPPPATWRGLEPLERDEQFDAILRAHKRDRLAIPVQALRATGAPYHGFERMPPRRLAWFVPTLLASWLSRAPGSASEPFGAGDLEEILENAATDDGEDGGFTADESTALASFFEIALDAALATPLREGRAPAPERPLEDGVRVWSVHSPSVPLDVVRVARAFGVDSDDLLVRWALDDTALALDHLLEAVFDASIASKHYLSHEAVADRLAAGFFTAAGERQIRLSKAEATVRRNIRRRQDA